ncbi:DinB family protein [Planococcus sp. CAU13]|uniref:DinB family protein n=1 Tax=Planococcus sp. CAU13 TaxID=1541197 RepID=UPI00053007EF|nr:DinB family protein [Planococcus sp. CAU13]
MKEELLVTFKSDLSRYSLEQLRYISEEGVWSIGQMYDHLLLVAHEYLDSVELCETSAAEGELAKSKFGEELFRNGGFPPVKIRLPDEMNEPPNNTDSQEKLISRMDALIERMARQESKVEEIAPNRKVQHGGFGWLNSKEWYELVGMHFRHHLRQKSELEGRCRHERNNPQP